MTTTASLVRSIVAMQTLGVVLKVLLGCLLLWTGLQKIRYPFSFLDNVYEYEVLGPRGGLYLAIVLPWLELIFGIALLGGIMVEGALMGVIVLLGLFLAAQLIALSKGLTIGCGCFGSPAEALIGWRTLLTTGSLLLAGIVALVNQKHERPR